MNAKKQKEQKKKDTKAILILELYVNHTINVFSS